MTINKKGQMQMTETIAVLFIFFVLLLFGIIFYYKYQQVAVKEKQEELLAARAMDTTLKMLFLPELMCTKREAEPEDNCIDVLKMRQAKATFRKYMSDYYFGIFSYARIRVVDLVDKQELVLYDKEKTKVLDNGTMVGDWEKLEKTYFVVTLRDEIKGQGEARYDLGYIEVGVYS
ncbi:hypothetical protein HYX11_02280 [Candidatus Woesearchaeota archaeon]|nr:hypothetical protein [Candidatus Woesearchaeota archaeon]